MTPRDQFLAVLAAGPLLRADAIVVLAGEDGAARLETGLGLFTNGGAPRLVLAGGRHEPPAIVGASALHRLALEAGVAPSAIVVEATSRNTHEQATALAALVARERWGSLLLVASAYHLPRAFLTVVRALPRAVRVLPVPVTHTRWGERPPGGDRTRLELLPVEFVKIHEYQALGHCASYEDGLAALTRWEAA
jgi:uncharacterized SAM-binding protein YcdF (DUF218 family)